MKSRRKFIQQLGSSTALVAAAGMPALAAQDGTKWSSTADWISIGSGFSGCSAAVFGHDKGLKALILEKSGNIGGLTTQSGGTLWIPLSYAAKAEGIQDSREEAIEYLKYISGGYSRQEFMETMVDNAHRALQYLHDKADLNVRVSGAEFYYPISSGSKKRGRLLTCEPFPSASLGAWKDRVLPAPYYRGFTISDTGDGLEGGAAPARSAPQSLEPWRKYLGSKLDAILKENDDYRVGGAGLAAYAFRAVLKRGIEVRTETSVEKLLVDGGRVVGVSVTSRGKQENIRANKGVVLATGGVHSRILPGYGMGWKLAAEAGAAIHTEGVIVPQIYVQVPGENFGIGVPAGRSNYELRMPHSLVVNRFGERFGNESFFQDIGCKICDFENWGSHRFRNVPLYLIFDHALIEKNGFGGLPPGYSEGLDWVSQGTSLSDLAGKMKLPSEKLEATVGRFNKLSRSGKDTDFGREVKTMGPVEKPPFYGVELRTADPFLAISRVLVNTKGQVLHWKDEKPIPGFYACGGATASSFIWGIGYQGGFDLASGATFALLATEHTTGSRML